MSRPRSRLLQLIADVEQQVMRTCGTIVGVKTTHPFAALTFDDGPHPEYTPWLLDVLERHNARGTFFVIGEQARQYPHLIERIAGAGHTIANHTWDHPGFPLISMVEQRRQIRACAQALAPHGQRLFRPPYGSQTRLHYWNIRSLGYEVVTWTLAVKDWEYKSDEELARLLIEGVRPGSIILLHDRLVDPEDARSLDRSPMINAVEQLLAGLAGQMDFVTVPELLHYGRPVRAKWVKLTVP